MIAPVRKEDISCPKAMTSFEVGICKMVMEQVNPRSVYVEIGAERGGSFQTFGRFMPLDSTLIAIDLPGAEWGEANSIDCLLRCARKLRGEGYNAEVILGDSKKADVKDRVLKILQGRPIDFLYLDGDHSPLGLASDLQNYAPLVRPGGVVALHDCGNAESCVEGLPDSPHTQEGIRGIFNWFAYRRKWLLVQEWAGLGLVWMEEE